jgi:hypothetical protein
MMLDQALQSTSSLTACSLKRNISRSTGLSFRQASWYASSTNRFNALLAQVELQACS